jgi:L-alanine-DL-glutamate epimerase-like enolase superfamily enzyme
LLLPNPSNDELPRKLLAEERPMIVTKAEIAECRLPLKKEIRLGSVRVRSRDLVALRLTTEAGTVGEALGYTRGTPLFETTERIARAAIKSDVHMRRETLESFLAAHVNGRPVFHRAASLLDIALWDLAAKAAQLPLHQLLGAVRTHTPTMAVAGYYMRERGIADVKREVEGLIDQGAACVKLMLDGTDEPFDTACLSEIAPVASGRLAVDAHWSWDSVDQAAQYLRQIDHLGLCFIEDPFGAHRFDLLPKLKARLSTPIAVGEDVPETSTLASIARQFDLLRLDVTTCGGISAAISVLGVAALEGCRVLPHIFPGLHAQLAGAFSAIRLVEYIPSETGADPTHTLLARQPMVNDGILQIDQEPGAGLALNWDKVGAASIRRIEITE